jgi:hypothetical protein
MYLGYIYIGTTYSEYKPNFWDLDLPSDLYALFMCKAGRGIQSWGGETNMHFQLLSVF